MEMICHNTVQKLYQSNSKILSQKSQNPRKKSNNFRKKSKNMFICIKYGNDLS